MHHGRLGDRDHDRTCPYARSGSTDRPVEASSYQPRKAELEADMSVDMPPEQLAEATLGLVTIQTGDEDADT